MKFKLLASLVFFLALTLISCGMPPNADDGGNLYTVPIPPIDASCTKGVECFFENSPIDTYVRAMVIQAPEEPSTPEYIRSNCTLSNYRERKWLAQALKRIDASECGPPGASTCTFKITDWQGLDEKPMKRIQSGTQVEFCFFIDFKPEWNGPEYWCKMSDPTFTFEKRALRQGINLNMNQPQTGVSVPVCAEIPGWRVN